MGGLFSSNVIVPKCKLYNQSIVQFKNINFMTYDNKRHKWFYNLYPNPYKQQKIYY